MGSTMSHYQHCIFFAQLGELGGQSLHGSGNIIVLIFLPLPIHQGSTKGCFLEIVFVELVNHVLIGIFHAGDDVQGGHSYASITFLFQLGNCFLRSGIGDAFLSLNAVDNDVGGEGSNNLNTGMSSLNGVNSSIDSLFAGILKGGAKAHN